MEFLSAMVFFSLNILARKIIPTTLWGGASGKGVGLILVCLCLEENLNSHEDENVQVYFLCNFKKGSQFLNLF